MIPKDRVFSHDQPIGNHMAAPSPGIFFGGIIGKMPKKIGKCQKKWETDVNLNELPYHS